MQQRHWPVHAGFAVLWGLVFVLVDRVVDAVGWAAGAAATSLVFAVAVAILAVARGRELRWQLGWSRVLILGVAVAIQNAGIAIAAERAGITLTVVVLGSVPVFATLIGQLRGLTPITAPAVTGVVAGVLGLLLVVAFPRSGTGWSFLSGTLAGLLGAVATGFIISYARATTRPSGRVEAASGSSLLAAFLIAPLAVLFPSGQGSGSGWVWVLALGALVAFGRLHSDLLRSGSGRSGAIAAAKAVGMVLVVLGGAFLGQPLSFGQWLGAVLILGSSGLILPLFPDGSATSARR